MGPNIVFLLLDTARARNFSCYGYDRKTTPFIDKLAKDSVLYRNAFSNSIYSLPSYGSIFTGQYPSQHAAIDWNQKVNENTLVSGLNEKGYETHAVSTHLVSDQFGIGRDFDSTEMVFVNSRDSLFQNDPVMDEMANKANKDGWKSEREKYLYFIKLLSDNPSYKSLLNGGYQLLEKVRKSKGWWRDDGAAKAVESAKSVIDSTGTPFFLFMNFIETHDPYRPPRKFIRKFLPSDITIGEIEDALSYSSVRATLGYDKVDETQREILMALYDAELAYIDSKIEEFHTHLRKKKFAENTIFIIVSDHGDFFGKQGMWGHQGRVYNDVCHVPLIINYPWSSGAVQEDVTELRQLCDHLLSLADGNKDPLTPQGRALIEYFGLDTQLSFVPWDEYPEVKSENWGCYQCALVDDEYKLIWDANDEIELYNMNNDYLEEHDIAVQNSQKVSQYQNGIKKLVGTPEENHERYRNGELGRDSNEKQFNDGAGDEVAARLRELGYLD